MTEVSASEDGKVQRRRRSEEERRRIVAESLEPGASVSLVARRHDVNTNLVFTWRRRYGSGIKEPVASTTFVPAVISNEVSVPAPAVAVSIAGRMEIEVPGGFRLIAGNDVDTVVLGRVIKTLLPR